MPRDMRQYMNTAMRNPLGSGMMGGAPRDMGAYSSGGANEQAATAARAAAAPVQEKYTPTPEMKAAAARKARKKSGSFSESIRRNADRMGAKERKYGGGK